MKDKIYSISEAYSIQPVTLYVGGLSGNASDKVIAKIVEEDIYITGDPFEYYCGYDSDGNRLFEYKKGTVNVHYSSK